MLRWMFLSFLAACFGITVAAGYIALISMIGILPRLSSISKTVKYIPHYENSVTYGVCAGTLVYSFSVSLLPGPWIPILTALFGGVYVGCLAGALAEVVNTIPIFVRRAKIRKGIPYIIYAFAIGKTAGVLVQYFLL